MWNWNIFPFSILIWANRYSYDSLSQNCLPLHIKDRKLISVTLFIIQIFMHSCLESKCKYLCTASVFVLFIIQSSNEYIFRSNCDIFPFKSNTMYIIHVSVIFHFIQWLIALPKCVLTSVYLIDDRTFI